MLFQKKIARKSDRTRGSDGIRECDRQLLMQFQLDCEKQGKYFELKAALYCCRDRNFVVNPVNLQRFISDGEWADMGGTYN